MRREGERLCIDGPVTLANVTRVLQEGYAQLGSGVRVVDLAAVTELDSSLLAALLAWLRDARDRDAELSFINLPEGLTTIARLYGVSDLLPKADTGR
jgi:phospholipid transport system transporter-binding protein